MPPFRSWAELPPELLCYIGDVLDLKCYASARGVCRAWRRALPPPTPSLLVALDGATCNLSASSLPACRTFQLNALHLMARCVGCRYGWLALCFCNYGGEALFTLFNPTTGTEIILPRLIYGRVSKLVFAPSPTRDDFAAAAICDVDRLAYVTTGAQRWSVLDPIRLAVNDRLIDLIYHEEGRVYCLTRDETSICYTYRLENLEADDPSSYLGDAGNPLWSGISSHWLYQKRAALAKRRAKKLHETLHWRWFELPKPNARVTVQPLLSLPFDPATSFATPYNKVSCFTSAKNLVFCERILYQIWRNTTCTVTLQLPGGGHRRVADDEIFVLRYYPQGQPCWNVVTDLGGYSVFLGMNNAVSMYAEAFPGLKGNCVYWIGGTRSDQGMVYDMETRRSTACLLPATAGGPPQSAICWYFII